MITLPTISSYELNKSGDPPSIERLTGNAPAVARYNSRTGSAIRIHLPILVATTVVVLAVLPIRWRIATNIPWQGDEIPLLVRSTGLCGLVNSEVEAAGFQPSFYSFYMGAFRSLRTPKYLSSIHTSSAFWTNLTIHLFGCTPGAGRLAPFLFSLLAIVTAGWAAWWLFRDVPAVCFASGLVALSPAVIAYGGQARGYAESVALAPLLLVGLESLRRKPSSTLRVLLVFLCALSLSLTVYTTWVYFVLPVVALSVWVLPRYADPPTGKRDTHTACVVILSSLLVVMSAYTWSRANYLLFSSAMGLAPSFIRAFGWGTAFFVGGILIVPLVIAGTVLAWRRGSPWWLYALVAAALMPMLVSVLTGSYGFTRNLLFWVGLLAALAGGGASHLLQLLPFSRHRIVSRWAPPLCMAAVGFAWVPSLEARATLLLPPDWGSMVSEISAQSIPNGPRWFCECQANHWQINWYRPDRRPSVLLDRTVNQSAELVIGAQVDEHDNPVVFQFDNRRNTIAPFAAPRCLTKHTADSRYRGLLVWRFVAQEVDKGFSAGSAFVIARYSASAGPEASRAAWHRISSPLNGLAFKSVPLTTGELHSLMIPAEEVPTFLSNLESAEGGAFSDVRVFNLTPLKPEPNSTSSKLPTHDISQG